MNQLIALFGKVEENLEAYIGAVAMIAYTIVILYSVFSRYLLDNQPSWTLPIVLGMFTWISWLVVSWAIRKDSHFRFTLFRAKLSREMNYLLRYVDVIAWVVIALTIFVLSIDILSVRIASGRNIIGTSIPLYLAYLALPVGMVTIIIRSLQQIFIIRKKYHSGKEIVPESSL